MKLMLFLISLTVIVGCATSTLPEIELKASRINPYVDIEARRLLLQDLSYKERRRYCHDLMGLESIDIRLDSHVRLGGKEADLAGPNSQWYFLAGLNKLISLYVSGDNSLNRLYEQLDKAAQSRAYEKLQPFVLSGGREYNVYNEPIWHQAHILLPIGIIYPELERVYGREDLQVTRIRDWGNRIYESVNSGRDNPSQTGPDLPASKALGSAIWGAATKDTNKINQAYQHYAKAIHTIGDGGQERIYRRKIFVEGKALSSRRNISREVRYRDLANQVYGYSVITAEALVRAGIPNAYDLPENGRSLHDAVKWLLENTERGDLHIDHWDIGSQNVAWYEIYAARFPENAKKLEQETFIGDMLKWEPKFFGANMGGATTCLFRPIKKSH